MSLAAALIALIASEPAAVVRLVGSWRFEDAQLVAPEPGAHACGTDFGVSYGADGRFVGYDEAGEWRVADGELVETVWEPEVASGLTPRATRPEVRRFRIEWLSPDVVNLRDEAGGTHALIRCSELETDA